MAVAHPCASCSHKDEDFHFTKCPGLRKTIAAEICRGIVQTPPRKATLALREYRKATTFKLR